MFKKGKGLPLTFKKGKGVQIMLDKSKDVQIMFKQERLYKPYSKHMYKARLKRERPYTPLKPSNCNTFARPSAHDVLVPA